MSILDIWPNIFMFVPYKTGEYLDILIIAVTKINFYKTKDPVH